MRCCRLVVALMAAVGLNGLPAAASAAALPDADGAVCTADLVTHGTYGPVPVLNAQVQATVVLDCIGVADDAGTWAVAAMGTAIVQSCEEEAANLPVQPGTPAGGDGTIVSGNLVYERDGAVVRMAMSLVTTGGEQNVFEGELIWTSPLPCPSATETATGVGTMADFPLP